jgi:ketosteroid isomerase-like protein
MTARAVLLACLGAVLLASCGPGVPLHPPVDTAKVVDAIKTDEVHWNEDWRSGDAAKLTAHYSPDAVVMAPGYPAAVGSAAIRAMLDQVAGQPGFTLAFSSDRVDVAASGDLATTHGAYKQTSTDAKTGALVTETGSYVTVYKPGSDGVWKAVLDINTPGGAAASTPAPASAPPP